MAASTVIPNAAGGRRTALLLSVLTLGVLGILGCGESTIVPPQLPSNQAYWALELNQHAVMLALQPTYDTVQLTATPFSASGAPITSTGTVTFKSLDTTVVTVSATGLVTAHILAPVDNPVRVIAALQDPAQGVTHADTVRIAVTGAPLPAITTYSMQPAAGDSAKRALPGGLFFNWDQFNWPVRAIASPNDTLCDSTQCQLLVHYTSSRSLVATIDPSTGVVTEQDTGRVVFTAQTLAYGRVLRDSVDFRIGYMVWYPLGMVFTMVLGVLTLSFMAPKKLVLGVGATIVFCNGPSPNTSRGNHHPVDVVFDHPEAVDSATCVLPASAFAPSTVFADTTGNGNIAPFGGDSTHLSYACRRFPVPGVYHYHSTLFPSDTYEIDIQQDPQ